MSPFALFQIAMCGLAVLAAAVLGPMLGFWKADSQASELAPPPEVAIEASQIETLQTEASADNTSQGIRRIYSKLERQGIRHAVIHVPQ